MLPQKKMLIALMIFLSLAGCKKEGSDGWIQSIEDGKYFVMGNTLGLYYIDENNNGIIDPDNIATLPYTYPNGILPSEIKVPTDFDKTKVWLYNGNFNGITYESAEKRMIYGSTGMQGDQSRHDYTFYISCNGVLDKFDAKWSYKPGAAIGGNNVATRLDELKINGTVVANQSNLNSRKVFIKRVNGKTVSISVKE